MGVTQDKWGIVQLYATKSGEVSWYLNDGANNSDVTIHEVNSVTKKTEKGLTFFRADVKNGSLKSGGSRPTFRVDIRATGEHNGSQKYGANDNPGYLNSPNDIGDAEFTALYRISNKTGEHNMGFKCRGGDHHDSSDDAADIGIAFPTAPVSKGTASTKNYTCFFEKELIHAQEDNIGRPALVACGGMPEGKWILAKAVTFVSGSNQVTNQLWADQDPLDFSTSPPTFKNNFVKVAEYIDKGEDTGQYAKCVKWRGCTWSIRLDNAQTVDFNFISLRSISSSYQGGTGAPGGGSGGGSSGLPPPPVYDDGSGGSGSGGGTTGTGGGGSTDGGTTNKPPTAAAILRAPPVQNTVDNKGNIANPPQIHLIFWGSYWNGTPTSGYPSMNQIKNAISDIFDTKYFDSLYQYRGVKRPVLVESVVNTTFAVKNNYTVTDVNSLIKNCFSTNLINDPPDGEALRHIYYIMSDPTHNNGTGSQSYHGQTDAPDNLIYAMNNAKTTLDDTTDIFTTSLVNAITDNIPYTGIVLKSGTSVTDTTPKLATPAKSYVIYGGGKQYNPLEVYFIFNGSYWSSGAGATAKSDLMNKMTTLFASPYFDTLFQYGFAKRPILKSSVVQTNYLLHDQFNIQEISNCVANAGLPTNDTTKQNIAHFVLAPPTMTSSSGGLGWHDAVELTSNDGVNKFWWFCVWIDTKFNTTTDNKTETITHELTELISDNLANHNMTTPPGYYIKEGTPLNDNNGAEIADVCQSATGSHLVNGVYCAAYWSDQNGACVVPTNTPNWISCPSGSTWDNTTQTCKLNANSPTNSSPNKEICYPCGEAVLTSGITNANPTTPTPTSSDPILAAPLAHEITVNDPDNVAVMNKDFTGFQGVVVHFIYWGSAWSNQSSPFTKAQLDTKINAIFNSEYFSGLYQYYQIRKPVIGRIVINTTFSVKNNFTSLDIYNLIKDSITKGLVPDQGMPMVFDPNNPPKTAIALYVIIGQNNAPASSYVSSPYFHDGADNGKGTGNGYIFAYNPINPAGFASQGYSLTHEIIEAITDPIIGSGVITKPGGRFGSQALEICDPDPDTTTYTIAGHKVCPYWSDEDNAFIAPSATPTWVSCSSGMNYDSLNQICKGTGSTTGQTGYKVSMYWSDEDNKCIAPETSPTWISCPTGYKWDEVKQECVSTGNDTTGGGTGGGGTDTGGSGGCGCTDPNSPPDPSPTTGSGGTGGTTDTGTGTTTPAQPPPPPLPGTGGTGGVPQQGSANTVDLGVAGAGGGAQPEGQSIMTFSKDWKFIFNVGVSTEDHCTRGNPLEARDYVPIFDVELDNDPNGYDDLGYSYGDGVIEMAEYINTEKSSLYKITPRKVTVKSIQRLIDENGNSCTGYIWCYIKNYITNQVMANIGDVVDVSRIDVNEQSLDFIQDDNTYELKLNDMVIIHYEDPSAGIGKALRIKRTVKDTIDSINSFYAINDGSGYLGNADNDLGIIVYT